MSRRSRSDPEWREFEALVARIEADADPFGLTVKSPDRIRDRITGRSREVDASIYRNVGSTRLLVTIECRRRRHRQDVTWIEQLAAKKEAIGADRTIAVSATGFTAAAHAAASQHGIDLRQLSEVSAGEICEMIRLDAVFFTHKQASVARVSVRLHRKGEWTPPDPAKADIQLGPHDVDPFTPIFHSDDEDGAAWSCNDLWRQLQEATDPFAGLVPGQPPVLRTACFPYPGNVVVDTEKGPQRIGDVMLTMALSLEVEVVSLEAATKVAYGAKGSEPIHRVEFTSRRPEVSKPRLALQATPDAMSESGVRITTNFPGGD